MAPGPVLIAGAGIGGLTAALAIAQRGFEVAIFDQAERLEEIGAGIQLSPNASRILLALGLGERLQRHVVAPEELRVMSAKGARVLACAPLGASAAQRYGAPYWVIHRGDLQAVLLAAVAAQPDITLHLGARIDDFAQDGAIISALTVSRDEHRGIALIAADGLWSRLRARLRHGDAPRFAGQVAWRALAPADAIAADLRAPAVNLWFDTDAHLVHYPVRGGSLINVVAIARNDWHEPGWSAPANRDEVFARYSATIWPPAARALLAAPQRWQKWALYDRPPLADWGRGAATLLGDAAHPMLPYLAQGAAMAIEDAALLAQCLALRRNNPAGALRAYEQERSARSARAQRAAHRNGAIYHLGKPGALLRQLALKAMGGERLLTRYDWLYGWTPS
jgi:salicylate hydroxylase